MIKYYTPFVLLILIFSEPINAQESSSSILGDGGYAFGVKGGATVATQTWNGFQRNALFSYHADAFVEMPGTWKQKNGNLQRSSFLTQLGYHRKGSAFRNVFYYSNNNSRVIVPPNEFHNLSLTIIGKGNYLIQEKSLAYYGFGLRLDYTIDYQLLQNSTFGVNRFNYGVWIGGGYEWVLGKGPWALFLEANISPDISRQVFIPGGLPSQYTDASGNPLRTTEQKVYNLIFELSLGFKIYK